MKLSNTEKKELKLIFILVLVMFAFGYVSEADYQTETDKFCMWAEENEATDTIQFQQQCEGNYEY